MSTSATDLPTWLSVVLPPLQPPTIVSADGTMFCTTSPQGTKHRFATVEQAYDSVEGDCRFERSVLDVVPGAESLCGSIVVPGVGSYPRVLRSCTDEGRLAFLTDAYREFADEIDPAWRADPDDWYLCHRWLNRHPCFWTASSDDPWRWETSGGIASLSVRPWRDTSGRTAWIVDGGAHVPPDYTRHYVDCRLDVTAGSARKALRQLARTVDTLYAPDGSQRNPEPMIDFTYPADWKDVTTYIVDLDDKTVETIRHEAAVRGVTECEVWEDIIWVGLCHLTSLGKKRLMGSIAAP